MNKIQIYDTTLRDGEQGKGISFTVQDKIKITQMLDDYGFDYIEGGWPGSNPKAIEFFKTMQNIKLKTSKLAAFSSTRRAKLQCKDDPNIQSILDAKVPVATIFGKSWDLHVTRALEVPLEYNLEMIFDTVKYLKDHGLEVIFDAEHFFDGYKRNPDYAMKTLHAACEGGADLLALCDTNGGLLPSEMANIIPQIIKQIKKPLGIHVHNDGDMAIANTITAVENGVTQVQGTVNGFGERCGNANLCSVIATLQLKMGISCVSQEKLAQLTSLSRRIYEIANLVPYEQMPYVGKNAFAHKAGVHVSAIMKDPETYEHINPALVGNTREVTISELSGISNLIHKAKGMGITIDKDSPEIKKLIQQIKNLENLGYAFEEGEASLELLLWRAMGKKYQFFSLEKFRIIDEKSSENSGTIAEATIKIHHNDETILASSEGKGPVEALENVLRKSLEKFYPHLVPVRLIDYKVRMLNKEGGAKSFVRVMIDSTDGESIWSTVGVSDNIIEASWLAVVDSIEYKLLKEHQKEL